MFKNLKVYLRNCYYLKIKKLSNSDYVILKMRKQGIEVGENCRIFSDKFYSEPTLIKIGNNVTISSDVLFCTHDNGVIKVLKNKTDAYGKIVIGDNCFIGMNTILMLGVELGDNCIVGAGSVVTKSFKPGTVLAGNPARAIGTVDKYAAKIEKYAVNTPEIAGNKAEFFKNNPQILIKKKFYE